MSTEALAVRFRAACARYAERAHPELDATALATACRDVLNDDSTADLTAGLPVDGVSITITSHDPWRLPVGASDPAAAAAERWQFTSGGGPSTRSWATGEPVVTDRELLQRAWPVLHDLLHRHTPYRSTVTLPLHLPRQPSQQHGEPARGVVDLYFHRERPVTSSGPGATPSAGLARAQAVAALISTELWGSEAPTPEVLGSPGAGTTAPPAGRGPGRAPTHPAHPGQPAWMDAPGARRRQRVWMVLSMARQALRTPDADALALLRATAYTRDRTLEALADEIVEGHVPLRSLHTPPHA
ncbi:hypothetical protein MO973_17975 [Paenibacillus sp. TRM 82003]|uniref:hypothetical protein n=1 Tax=Kineococcus sp. TRM81007 TaxID=2925831 RepID=UPI001F55F08C|nr:hypothetical protein [Kineococcus sp. TRM81007]MCI2238368.1 hypothetical protein [Kineococcus sp. TRM81007]MCI3922118.1 hypothetical protein [Paenibacillus sp. TRM 82003]